VKLEPFYFFADLLIYGIGENYRRTVVVKINDESQEMAIHNLKRLYRAMYLRRKDDYNLIPATETDWLEFQATLDTKKKKPNPVTINEPRKITRPSSDISGQKIPDTILTARQRVEDKFSVADKEGRRRRIEIWLFDCECGLSKEIIKSNVTRGITKSCGCLRKQSSKDRIANARKFNSKNQQAVTA
jgi:hypothetical protein